MYKVAWISPVFDEHFLKSAAYSGLVLPLLAKDWEIEVFVDDSDWNLYCQTNDQVATGSCREFNFPVFHYLRLAERMEQKNFDLFIYNIEDHPRCAYVCRTLPIWPGIVIFHDLNLNRLYLSYFSHCTAAKDINQLLVEEFGDQTPALGEYFIRGWSLAPFDKLYACGRRELEAAAAIFALNSAWHKKLQRWVGEKPVWYSTLPVRSPELNEHASLRLLGRRKLAVDDRTLLCTFFGEFLLADCACAVIQAFTDNALDQANARNHDKIQLIWLAANETDRSRFEHFLEQQLSSNNMSRKAVRVISYSSHSELEQYCAATDVVLGLRSDDSRTLSLGFFKALSHSAVGIVLKIGQGLELAGNMLFSLPLDAHLKRFLLSVMTELAENPILRKSLGKMSREYVLAEHDPSSVAQDLKICSSQDYDWLAKKLVEKRNIYYEAMNKHLERLYDCEQFLTEIVSSEPGSMFAEDWSTVWKSFVEPSVTDFCWKGVGDATSTIR